MLQPGDEILYDISWFICSCTSLGTTYYNHLTPYMERLPFNIIHSFRTGFSYTIPCKVLNICTDPYQHKMLFLEVFLPDIEIFEKAYSMSLCKKMKYPNKYCIKVPYEEHCIKQRLLTVDEQHIISEKASLEGVNPCTIEFLTKNDL